jgi:predicted porin
MNKKLVAAALGLAFAAPVFADSSNVTLYGRVHQAIDFQSNETNGGNATLEDVSSRFGIRGQEDLGGGLSAIFAYEFSVQADNNSGVGGRHSYLGLKGSWGTFVVGKQDGGNDSVAPLYTQASLTGGVSNQGGPLTTIGGGTASLANDVAISRTQRTDNSFGYKTNIAGVAIEARHALRGDDDAANNSVTVNNNISPAPVAGIKENGVRETEVAATYKVGALTVGGGFQLFDQQAQDPTTNARPERTIQGVAAYNFGSFTLAGLVAQTKLYSANVANGKDDNTEYLVSATVPLSANSGLFGSYSDSERNNLAAANDLSQTQIAYYYDFSKRTRTYVGFNRFETENTVGPRVEVDQDNFTIGLRHNF